MSATIKPTPEQIRQASHGLKARKKSAAALLGRLGGDARMASTTPEERRLYARMGAAARWGKRQQSAKPQESA